MIYTVENTIVVGIRPTILDARGREIKNVISFDSTTHEVEVALEVGHRLPNKSVTMFAQHDDLLEVTAKTIVRGSRILLDGKEERDFWNQRGPSFESGYKGRLLVTSEDLKLQRACRYIGPELFNGS